MPRCAREISLTGYYHVFDRGNSKQIIFEDDFDRYRFLSDISDRFACHDVAVLAWCLMGQANCPYHRYRRYKRNQGHHRLERGGLRYGFGPIDAL